MFTRKVFIIHLWPQFKCDFPFTRYQDIDKILAVQKTVSDCSLDGGVDLLAKQCMNSLTAKGTICSIHLELS